MNKKKRELPLSTVRLVAAMCGDYPRMKEALRKGKLSYQLEISFFTITHVIYEEAAQAVSLAGCQAEELIADIGANRGYRGSHLAQLIGKNRYYRGKDRAVRGIAERLFLIEEE